MATRAAAREAARAQSTRSGRVPQQLIDELIRPGLGQKDVRLRSLAPTARRQEAIRRLNDPETAAGKPGTNLCRYAGDDKQMTGKRPGYYNKRNISASAVRLCKDLVDEAWSDPGFLKEEKLACGEDKKWVFAHQRGDKRVKGHCRKVDAPRPRAKKAKADPREMELAALIRTRDGTSNLSEYTALNTQIKALRAELKPRPAAAAARKAAPVQPAIPPPSAQVPVRKQTRRTPTPFSIGEIPEYLNTLARGERGRAEAALRQYMEGPAQLNDLEALQAYKDRKLYDARMNVGPTEFDDSGEEDQDVGEFGSGLDGGDAEEDLRAARAEHAAMGDNALDGSQLSELLAGQGGPPTIAAY
eukprot:COSAG06_NODE_8601_length_2118_cov_0.856860_3_plen_358_part_00